MHGETHERIKISDMAARSRRTVPQERKAKRLSDDGFEHASPSGHNSIRSSLSSQYSTPTMDSMMDSMMDSTMDATMDSTMDQSRSSVGDHPIPSRRLEPVRQSFANPQPPRKHRSLHSRGSKTSTINSISTQELKRSMARNRKKKKQSSSNMGSSKSSSGQADLFTIGQASFSVDLIQSPAKQSRKQLEPLDHEVDKAISVSEPAFDVGFGESFQSTPNMFSEEKRSKSLTETRSPGLNKTPFTMRTPFEVDAPREPLRRSNRNKFSSMVSATSDTPNPLLSEEQDAWAGIDELLETKSVDGSVAYSTSDILPRATVRAMRRGNTFKWTDEETVMDDDGRSEAGESRISWVPPLRRIPSGSGGKKNNFNRKGNGSGRHQESWNASEAKDMLCELPGQSAGEAGLFGMFQWSDKDNIDEQRRRKGKLNSRARKARMFPTKREVIDDSDASSLPSLATYRPDDLSVMSRDLGSTFHSDMGSVVTENSRDEYGFEIPAGFGKEEESVDSFADDHHSDTASESTSSRSSLAGDGLILDKGVDEYIRQIQQQLPTISEHGAPAKGKKQVGFAGADTSPSPTSVVGEETAFDELPSLSEISGGVKPPGAPPSTPRGTSNKGRKEEKRDLKSPSLSFLVNSFKKMSIPKPQKKLGDEEKYFPEEVLKHKSKKYNANRCLLSEGDDGVNWDAD